MDRPDFQDHAARTSRADAIRAKRAGGPGLLSRLPGMAYQCRSDERLTLEFVSAGSLALTGLPPAELIGENTTRYLDLIHPEDRDHVLRERRAAVDEGRPFEVEYRIRTPSGERKWVWDHGHPVRDPEGGLLGMEGFAIDITEREELEEQLREAQKREALAELTAAVAHDFNNFLTGILGAVSLASEALEEDSPARAGPHLDLARAIVERAAGLTRQLLTFSRKDVARPETFDLNTVVDGMASLLSPLVGPTATLEVHAAPSALWLHLDAVHMEQVIMNLVLNARDAMPGGGIVTVRTGLEKRGRGADACVVLEVTDTGRGMDDKTRERIFSPFFTTKEHGTGLGLSIVRRIVEDAGGEIDVESDPGGGTTFRIELPTADEPLAEAAAPKWGVPALGLEAGGGSGHSRMLIVEQDDPVRRMMCEALAKQGYDVCEVGTAAAAREFVDGSGPPPDLLLTGLPLPDGSGAALAGHFRERHPDGRILLIVSSAPSDPFERASLTGTYPFLEKPFSMEDLVEAVQEVLQPPQ